MAEEKMVILQTRCVMCCNYTYVNVKKSAYDRWMNGELAQVCFADLKPSDREILISQICPACQKDIFDDDVEDFEEEWLEDICDEELDDDFDFSDFVYEEDAIFDDDLLDDLEDFN